MQPCPQQGENPRAVEMFGTSKWLDDRTCSYCGSMHPDDLFAAIEAGSVITPTDKSYKIYVDLPHPDAGKPCVLSSANFERIGDGWVKVTPENINSLPLDDYQRTHFGDGKHWVQVTTRSDRHRAKFYFEHLTREEQQRFIDLLNAKKVALAVPGYFYVRPFFIAPPERPAAA